MANAEILATGDELRTGALVDSNSAWLAEQLEACGIRVNRLQCVGDSLNSLVQIMHEISSRADFALLTGGLGPTADDLTAQAVAKAAGQPLVKSPKALEHIQTFFAQKGRQMPDSNLKQAYFPEQSEMIENPLGTAPGFYLSLKDCLFFCLPGVPAEMKKMFQQTIKPKLKSVLGNSFKETKILTLRSFGLTESESSERLKGFAEAFPGITLGYRAKFPEIQFRLYIEDNKQQNQDQAVQWIRSRLGKYLFSDSGQSLEEVIGKILTEKKSTLAVAESCTGGLISHLLTNNPGSSEYFLFSATTYSNQAKQDLLRVSEQTLKNFGAVHEKTAAEMAQGIKTSAGSDYGLSTTGIAGPTGGTEEKPVGTVCIGLATPSQCLSKKLTFKFSSRHLNKKVFAMSALDLLRKKLED